MDLFSILCFVTLVKCSKFGVAADQLNLSQSSFSKHIQSLERNLDAKLFIRRPNGSVLTEAGDTLLPYAESILKEYDRVQRLLGAYSKSSEKRLIVYSHSFLAHFGITEMFVQFQNKRPDIQLEISELESRYAIQAMQDKPSQANICIAFSELGFEDEQFDQCHLLQEELVLLVGNNHRFAHQHTVPLSMLRNECLQILQTQQSPFMYEYVVTQCRKAGFTPKVSLFALHSSTIPEVLGSFDYVSILPRRIAEPICGPDIKLLRLEGADCFTVLLLKHKSYDSEAANALFDFAKHYTFELQLLDQKSLSPASNNSRAPQF